VRLAGSIAVLLVAKALDAAPPAKLSTAVFTLDARQRVLRETQDNPLANQLAQWAAQCRMEPGGAIAILACPATSDALETPTQGDPSEEVPATLALFRDLDETIYLAGCPLVEQEPAKISPSGPVEPGSEKVKPEDLRDCRDIAAGQTFSTEVEGEEMRIVVRGRQLAFRVFEVQEKPRTTATPYVPTPSERMPPAGPSTRSERKGLEPQNEPRWDPPQLSAASAGKPSESKTSDVAPARTSLGTGRVTIQCPSREFVVLIDGVYIGTCPVTTTLVAGKHTLTIRPPGKAEQVREIQVRAGKSIQLRLAD
jgi:hypothetical protein